MTGRAYDVLLKQFEPAWVQAQGYQATLSLRDFAIDECLADYNRAVNEYGSNSREARYIKAMLWLLERG